MLACNYLNFKSNNLNSSNQTLKSIGYFERSSTFFALRVETHVGFIRSILEDSSILSFFFRFSLLMLCLCCKVRDWHTSRCVKTTKHKQQQRPCILVHDTHTTQEESADSSRRNVAGAILYCHRYKRSYARRPFENLCSTVISNFKE